MDFTFNSKRCTCTVAITLSTAQSENMHLIVKDAYKPYTIYTDRTKKVNGKATFYVRMPQSPEQATIELYNESVGNMPKLSDDPSFKLLNVEKIPLKSKFTLAQLSPKVQSFVHFSQWFSENAGILSAAKSIYISEDNQFRIDYVDIIRDRQTGKTLNTPARISQETGVIEVSKYHFKGYTVPMRMAILLHEFCHFYINRVAHDESEADLNALLIYLGLGYPRIEAHYAWLKVFMNTPSNQNVARHKKIAAFIDNFEKMDIKPI